MNAPATTGNEAERVVTIHNYQILDTPPEPAFDELTGLAAQICSTPFAVIGLADGERVWFKSRLGLEVTEVPRATSFCGHAILEPELLVVPDAAHDPRFSAHPLVQGDPHIQFCAAIKIVGPEGLAFGALAVLDTKPRELTGGQQQALGTIARQVSAQLELRRSLAGVARSVEEHKRIEEQLRTSEAFYHTLVETLPQNIFRKDAQGRFTFCNKKFCQSLGRPLNEIIGKTDYDFFPPELAAKYHRDDLRVMNTLENIETIEAHQSPTGEKLFVHVLKTPLYDATGWVIGIQGMFWDVTQRKKTEEALAYERDLLRGLLNNIPDRIYFKDVESRFLRCSHSMALRLGVNDPKEVLGKTDFDFHPRELAQEFYADEQRIILTGRSLVNKLERQFDKDGQEIWASVTKVPIYNHNGHVTGIIGISRDITRLKKTEMALQQARDAALQSARAKSEFLANMSHEIRTPMNAIVGMTGLLLDTRLTQEQKEFAHTIRDSTQSLLGIINDILDFSKVESGKFSLEIIDFDLREAIESTVDMLAENAQKKGIELVCWVDHDLPQFLRGDPGRFRQILANLVSNAIKFTAKGEVVLRVKVVQETDTLVIIHIAVQDTGIGIDPKATSVIFQAFTQADGSTTRKYGGTGLGLAISKQLVDLMHGEIGVESRLGHGSTFWLKLPFEKQQHTHPLRPARNFSIFSSHRILVAEDHPTQRDFLAYLLQHLSPAHLEVLPTDKALPALRQAARDGKPFSIAILDGAHDPEQILALAQHVKTDPALAKARLLMLSSLGRRLDPAVMEQHAIRACITKPFRLARFYDVLEAVAKTEDASVHLCGLSSPSLEPFSGQSSLGKQARILLAEDNAVNQRLALMQLKKLGLKADAVVNGTEVLDALNRIPYNVILLDCQMPEMDGYEVSRRIRERYASNSTIPAPYIIALTANALQGDRERCFAAGMDDYLVKPLHLSDLEAALARALLKLPPAPQTVPDTASQPPKPEILDRAIISSLKGLREKGQPDPLKELVELFLGDGRAKLGKLDASVASNDAPAIISLSHSLKGSSSNLGARRLAAASALLEKTVKAGDLSEAANLLLDVKSEFEHVEQLLLAELRT